MPGIGDSVPSIWEAGACYRGSGAHYRGSRCLVLGVVLHGKRDNTRVRGVPTMVCVLPDAVCPHLGSGR